MKSSQRVQKDKLIRMADSSLSLFIYRFQLSKNPRQASSAHTVENIALHCERTTSWALVPSFVSFLALRVLIPSQDSSTGRLAPFSEVETSPDECVFHGGISVTFTIFPRITPFRRLTWRTENIVKN